MANDFDALAQHGRTLLQKALDKVEQPGIVQDLHRGLGSLVAMLRRRERLTPEALAAQARIDAVELCRIESDPTCDPNPRTIFQLEQFFKLPARSLVALSGAVRVDDAVRSEAVRFAASSQSMSALTREESKVLNKFVKFLSEHTDK